MYEIIGVSRFGSEVIDTADNLASARYLVAEYRMAFGPGWRITFRHIKG